MVADLRSQTKIIYKAKSRERDASQSLLTERVGRREVDAVRMFGGCVHWPPIETAIPGERGGAQWMDRLASNICIKSSSRKFNIFDWFTKWSGEESDTETSLQVSRNLWLGLGQKASQSVGHQHLHRGPDRYLLYTCKSQISRWEAVGGQLSQWWSL